MPPNDKIRNHLVANQTETVKLQEFEIREFPSKEYNRNKTFVCTSNLFVEVGKYKNLEVQ